MRAISSNSSSARFLVAAAHHEHPTLGAECASAIRRRFEAVHPGHRSASSLERAIGISRGPQVTGQALLDPGRAGIVMLEVRVLERCASERHGIRFIPGEPRRVGGSR